MSMLLFVVLANVLMGFYVRAAVRDALDDGVRSSVPVGVASDVCQRRIDDAVGSLVRGRFSSGVTTTCTTTNGTTIAVAQVRVPSFLPMLFSGWSFTLHASARVETP